MAIQGLSKPIPVLEFKYSIFSAGGKSVARVAPEKKAERGTKLKWLRQKNTGALPMRKIS
jgi:hypothetical protein